ncbi:MAG: hypothetical protein HXN79_11130 [Prevotella pallens]|uniref:hypothetical protein n=1 Tax=Prevotella pallens TaxID=60133 RepID=UPI001CB1313F|nr:hypothetical protein [Prevotella pallens]MBF1488838.1 hypothetical protein [Prevotella pallens]
MWRTLCKISTFNYEFPNERPQKHPTNIPQGIFINSLRPFHQQKQLVLGFVTLCVTEIIWHVLFS